MPAKRDQPHNFHFSGKVILCSVLLGFMLVLVGGILVAIGMDRQDGDLKTDDYEDMQRKAPMGYVGPVLMSIGGFAVMVGVFMCLFETNVCRKRRADSRPLISDETAVKSLDVGRKESRATAIPSTSRHKHRKKSPKTKSPKERSNKKTSDSPVAGCSHLTTSDKFLTPPSSFQSNLEIKKDIDRQTSTSWNANSTEFQTPIASFTEEFTMELQHSSDSEEITRPIIEMEPHSFVTPTNSDADKLTSSQPNKNLQVCVKITQHDDQKVENIEHNETVFAITKELESEDFIQPGFEKHHDSVSPINDQVEVVNLKDESEKNENVSTDDVTDAAVEKLKVPPVEGEQSRNSGEEIILDTNET